MHTWIINKGYDIHLFSHILRLLQDVFFERITGWMGLVIELGLYYRVDSVISKGVKVGIRLIITKVGTTCFYRNIHN